MGRAFLIFSVLVLSQASNAIEKYSCIGTEPFWSLELSDNGAVFDCEGKNYFKKVVYQAPENRQIEYEMHFQSEDKPGLEGHAALTNYSCSDDMSDRAYPYAVHFKVGTRVFSGCCVTPSKPARTERL